MDKIYIKGLQIFAFHGVNAEEKENGQNFILDITLWADLKGAKKTDCLSETINYAAVRKTVQKAFTAEKYDLIERAAKVVCDSVIAEYSAVQKIGLCLKKPEAPMNAIFEYVALEITEERDL